MPSAEYIIHLVCCFFVAYMCTGVRVNGAAEATKVGKVAKRTAKSAHYLGFRASRSNKVGKVAKRTAKCSPLIMISGRALARLSAKEGIGFGGAWPDGAESQQQPQPQPRAGGESDISGERTKP